jgi:ELWxxDGT repeat protein
MKGKSLFREALRREIILEALEDRIVLDAAVDHTMVDIAAHATEAVGAGATGDAAAHATDGAGVDPAGYWAWEHNAWCYHDTGSCWWWWPDASSPQYGNWLYQGDGWTGMWNYDWNHGWEWFFDAFYNDRYYYDTSVIVFGGGGLYWGQDGDHNWYFTADPDGNWDFSTWTAAVVSSNVDFGLSGSTGECLNPTGHNWVPYGAIEWTNVSPSTGGIPDPTAQGEDFGTYLYDVSPYFTDTGGGELSYYIVNQLFSGGLQLDGLSINHDTGVITFASHADSYGSVELVVQAYDGVLFSGYETFTLTVNPENDAPTSSGVPGTTIYEDFGTYVFDASGYFVDIDGDSLTYELGTVTYHDGLEFSSEPTIDAAGHITFHDSLNSNGYVDVQVRTFDGSAYSDYQTFTLTVAPVNDALTIHLPDPQPTNEDASILFSLANGNSISISDVDAGLGSLHVTISVHNGSLTLSQTTGLVFLAGGDRSDFLSFTGSLADINDALEGMTYSPDHNYYGADTLIITANDQGNTGSGVVLNHTDMLGITVGRLVDDFTWLDIIPGSSSSNPQYLTELDGDLYFQGYDSIYGAELWRYDPDTDTASIVSDIYSGSGSSVPTYLTVFHGDLYFSANDGTHGYELWRYDPDTAAASMVADIYSGPGYSSPSYLTVFNGDLYFAAGEGVHGYELWRYDPDTSTASMAADIYSAVGYSSNPSYLTVFNGDLYFQANDGAHGAELWRYDPDTSTASMADIYSGPGSSTPSYLTAFNGDLYFQATDGPHGYELWRYDPGADTASMVADIFSGSFSSSSPSYLTVFNGDLYFSANDATHGSELWRYDPGADTASMVANIYPGSAGSSPSYLTVFDDDLYFRADHYLRGLELWHVG